MNEPASPAAEPFPRLLDHMAWANRRALESTRAADDPEALRLISHVLAAERVWMRRLKTGDSSDLGIWPELSPGECADLLASNVEAYRAYLASLDATSLDRRVGYRNSAGREFHTPVREILHHVLLHGSHHRGQIARRLRAAGHEPVNMDFITFVREHPREDGSTR